jgi:hypothetical protein
MKKPGKRPSQMALGLPGSTFCKVLNDNMNLLGVSNAAGIWQWVKPLPEF